MSTGIQRPRSKRSHSLVVPNNQTQSLLSSTTSSSNNHSIIRTLLSNGFNTLITTSSPSPSGLPFKDAHASLPAPPAVSINVIEPTLPVRPPSRQQRQNQQQQQPPPQPPSFFNLIETTLRRDHNLTLHQIPYQNTRSGTSGIIESLPIQFLRMGGNTNNQRPANPNTPPSTPPTAAALTTTTAPQQQSFIKSMFTYNTPTDTSTHSAPPSTTPTPPLHPQPTTPSNTTDPSEWHTGPYCHVYIAACENTDHYKSKIRPQLSAFVSQIEANAAASNSIASHQYLIIYVPVPTAGAGAARNDGVMRGVGGGLRDAASRFVSRRGDTGDDDVSVVGSVAGNTVGSGEMGSVVGVKEKELFRKLSSDFPNGRLCVLSTLMDNVAGSGGASVASGGTAGALQTAEWNNLLKNLGLCVVAGFRERCKKYDEMLRALDKRRMKEGDKFDMNHYFLVKESLVFTYEQMQLPGEALLLYQELSAFASTGTWVKKRVDDTVADVALAGDFVTFRQCLREKSVGPMELHQYLFSREVCLLFLLRKPVEIIERVHHFIVYSYKMKMEDQLTSREEAEQWALTNAWDVKCACDAYFAQSVPGVRKISNVARGVNAAEQERDVARVLSELLEFARLRLLKLGDAKWETSPIRRASVARPKDTFEEWGEWTPVEDGGEGKEEEDKEEEKDKDDPSMLRPSSSTNAVNDVLNRPATTFGRLSKAISQKGGVSGAKNETFVLNQGTLTSIPAKKWLDSAFLSPSSYESKYLELSSSIIALYQHSGRHRFAARLQGEQAEIYMLRKEYSKAEKTLLNIADICAKDQWDKLHYWRLFRLACCQRRTPNHEAYLKTLVMCFSPRLAKIAPKKTYNLFQSDLEALVRTPSITSSHRLTSSPFLETELSITDTTSMGKSYHPLPYLRKKLIKYNCLVGDKIQMTIYITSHLPRAISVDDIRLFLLTFDEYESVYRRQGGHHHNISLEDGNAFRILSLPSNPPTVTINPGKNEFTFEWIPMTVGQFVLASVQVRWGRAHFVYDSAVIRRAIQGVDVLPSEPTQTIELNPLFLIPGEEQDIRLVFHSGKDIITGGMVELNCSEGLEVKDPNDAADETSWLKICTIPIPPCQPGEKHLIQTLVKSKKVEKSNADGKVVKFVGKVQTLHAKVTTSYHHALYESLTTDKGGEEPPSPAMTSEFEAMVTTLDRPALTVDDANAFEVNTARQVLVSISLRCNTPLPFFISEWNIDFPQPLSLAEGGDANDGLFVHPVTEGEILHFAFVCNRNVGGSLPVAPVDNDDGDDDDGMDDDVASRRPVLNVVLKDEFEKTFHQVLPLDLDLFYETMRKEDEYSGTNTAKTTLTCSKTDGVVGHPVPFKFEVEVATSKDLSSLPLLYTISCHESDWILGGRVRGIISPDSTASFALDFVGIPTQSGVIRKFPSIELRYGRTANGSGGGDGVGSMKDLPPIMVHCRFPEMYRSLSYKNHTALACPSALEIGGAGN